MGAMLFRAGSMLFYMAQRRVSWVFGQGQAAELTKGRRGASGTLLIVGLGAAASDFAEQMTESSSQGTSGSSLSRAGTM